MTVGGANPGVQCVFPFSFRGQVFNGCALFEEDDGKPWCSTLTDDNGVHVGGQGKWGNCPASCGSDTLKGTGI